MKKAIFILLFLACLAVAVNAPMPQSTPQAPAPAVLKDQVYSILGLIVPLMMALVVMAAAVYAVGQMFGAETRAKATIWAKSMLTAVGVAALLIAVLFVFLPNLDPPTSQDPQYLDKKLGELKNMAQASLIGLIVLLVVVAALVYAMGQMAGA